MGLFDGTPDEFNHRKNPLLNLLAKLPWILLFLFDFIEEELYSRKRLSEDIFPLLRIFSYDLRRIKTFRQVCHFHFEAQGNPKHTCLFRCFLSSRVSIKSDNDPRGQTLKALKVHAGKSRTGRSHRVSHSRLMRKYQIYLPFYKDSIISLAYLVFGFIQTVENLAFGEKEGIGTVEIFWFCLFGKCPTRESDNVAARVCQRENDTISKNIIRIFASGVVTSFDETSFENYLSVVAKILEIVIEKAPLGWRVANTPISHYLFTYPPGGDVATRETHAG